MELQNTDLESTQFLTKIEDSASGSFSPSKRRQSSSKLKPVRISHFRTGEKIEMTTQFENIIKDPIVQSSHESQRNFMISRKKSCTNSVKITDRHSPDIPFNTENKQSKKQTEDINFAVGEISKKAKTSLPSTPVSSRGILPSTKSTFDDFHKAIDFRLIKGSPSKSRYSSIAVLSEGRLKDTREANCQVQTIMNELSNNEIQTKEFILQSSHELKNIINRSKRVSPVRGSPQNLSTRTINHAHKKLIFLARKVHFKCISWNLSSKDLFDRQIVPKEHATSPNAVAFLKFARDEENEKAVYLLKRDRSLIFEYNHIGHNVYHICAKRNNHALLREISALCRGPIDMQDMSDRTALRWAFESKSIECVRLLLGMGASPFGSLPRSSCLNQDSSLRVIIEGAIKKHIQMKYFGPYKDRIKFYSSLMPFESLF